MNQRIKKYIGMAVMLITVLALAACDYGLGMSEEEIELMKIEQTIGRYLDGYAMNDSAQIMNVVDIAESKKDEMQAILDQFLQVLHHDPYTMRIVYEITDATLMDTSAEIKISAVLRIYEDNAELFSVRLFQDKMLSLVKDNLGEWKIDFSQFIPQELLNVEFLF